MATTKILSNAELIVDELSKCLFVLSEEEVDELEDRTIVLYGEWRAKARAYERDRMQLRKEETEEEPTETDEEESI